jgi:hypothetical protein
MTRGGTNQLVAVPFFGLPEASLSFGELPTAFAI